ncbi:MAG: PAS domain S-box protein, partial [Kiritimatiellaeota bacterium]|nr:PAS domain S-box protein [Kiritimatiellota bacterium]
MGNGSNISAATGTAESRGLRSAWRTGLRAVWGQPYRDMFENSRASMLLADAGNGRILDANPAACAFYGYPREIIRTLNWADLSTRSTADLLEQAAQLCASVGRYQGQHRLASGEVRAVEAFLSPLRIGGRPCLYAIVSDITAHRRNDERMQLQSAALSAAANSIVITDLTGRIIWANPAFARLTGYPLEEALGQNPRFLKSGRQDAAFYQRLWQTILAGGVWYGELVNRRKDQSLYTEEMTITPVKNAAGVMTHFVAVKVDISERRDLQQQLFQSQKMESIGRMAAGVAHDFNNLLQGILGFSDLLLNQFEEQDPRRQDVGEIRKAAQQAAQLTRQLLAFSRKQRMDLQVLDSNAVVQGAGKLLQRLLGENIALDYQLAPDLARIKADPQQIEQMLMNLAINGRDAMDGGGRLTVTTFNIALGEQDAARWADARPGGYVCLAVSDTGAGIAGEVLPHIFEPFFSTKAKGKGTGLGLATVYGIARQLEGWVHVYSQLGLGSTFKVYLPALASDAGAASAAPRAAASQDVRGRGERILLIEDEAGVRELVVRVLRENGYHVFAAADAAEARQLFEREQGGLELILSDVVLPDSNGVDLVQQFLARNPGLRIVMTSGYSDERSRWNVIRERGYRFLPKPYPLHEL